MPEAHQAFRFVPERRTRLGGNLHFIFKNKLQLFRFMFSTPAKTLHCVKLEKEDCLGSKVVLENKANIINWCNKKSSNEVTRSRSLVWEKQKEVKTERSRSAVPEKQIERKPRRARSAMPTYKLAGRSDVGVEKLENALKEERHAREKLEMRLRELEITVRSTH